MTFYAVAIGRQTGIFTQPWTVVCKYVSGYSGAKYKGFKTRNEAEKYMKMYSLSAALEDTKGMSSTSTEETDEKSGNLPGLHLYTDGGHHSYVASDGKKKVGSASAVVVVRDGVEIYHKTKFLGKQTNNIAELTAMRLAFQYIGSLSADVLYADDLPVIIHSDSEYTIGVVTGSMSASANLGLVRPMKAWYEDAKFKVQIKYIPAHSGYRFNERADQLCNETIDLQRISDV